MYDIRENCTSAFNCYDDNGLSIYVNSGKFRKIVGGLGEWQECNNYIQLINLIANQYNYGYMLTDLLDNNLPVLIYNGDKDYSANWQGA